MTRPQLLAALLALAPCAILPVGCASSGGRSPYAQQGEVPRDPQRARELQAEATKVAPSDEAAAERLLREALAADLYCGSAHNNLGVILLKRGMLYDAAGEFEWARKLMPGHPDPRVNLAMTLEKAGRIDDAFSAYDSALAVYDGYLPAVQGKARLQVATGRIDKETGALLEDIALRGDGQWREWALLWKTKLAQ